MSKTTCFQLAIVAILGGVLAGIASSIFLQALDVVTNFRIGNSWLLLGFPVFGYFFTKWVQKLPTYANQNIASFLKEQGSDIPTPSPWMAPFIFISAIGTHFFGGSAGRESVGVIMGISLTRWIPWVRPSGAEMRRAMIYIGIAAGFASIFGTPLAAVVFAFELKCWRDLKNYKIIFLSLLSAFVANEIVHLFSIQHFATPVFLVWDRELWGYVFGAAVASALGAGIFFWSLRFFSQILIKLKCPREWRVFGGASLLVFLVLILSAEEFSGISIQVLERAFQQPTEIRDYFLKCLFTVITLGLGFKGGEATPLFVMGATFANSFNSYWGLHNYALSASLGMVATFGAVTGTPLASALMAYEIFGGQVGLLALVVCFMARGFIGQRSVYRI